MVRKAGLLVCLAGFLSVSLAQASTITYTLTLDGCSGGGCGAPPYGTVLLDDGGNSGTVSVTLTLTSGIVFAGTGAGDALEFNLSDPNAAGLVITPADTTNYGLGPAPDTASAFGSFTNSIACITCSGGNSGNPPGPLVFTVTSTNGISLSDFTQNSGGHYFASDIAALLPGGTKTGNVAADGPGVPGVPEPATILLTLGGFGLAGLIKARKS
ncbi:MAG TPA: PEP-CTERM sorting domain-containing protein [Bryobacteraceae bacterium]|nr:PEP-CTERM sorting domain-containing protein [Bryobacteraceae bacterium]